MTGPVPRAPDPPAAAPGLANGEPFGALLAPVTLRTAGERIAERLVTAIALGEFVPGQRLPAERDLAAMLEVSRWPGTNSPSAMAVTRRSAMRSPAVRSVTGASSAPNDSPLARSGICRTGPVIPGLQLTEPPAGRPAARRRRRRRR